MAVLAFVLFFVLLGLVALFMAMRGGSGGARQRRQTQSRKERRSITALFLLALVGLGIAVPALVISSERNRDSVPEANLTELTAAQEKGRELFGQRCRNCHTLKAAGASAKVGPTLDEPPRPKALVLNAIEEGRAAGNGNMPADIFEGEDAEAVAEFVAAASGGDAEQ